MLRFLPYSWPKYGELLQAHADKVHAEMIQNYFQWFFTVYSNFEINQHRASRGGQLLFKVDDIKNHGVYITPDGYMMFQRMLEQDQANEDSKRAITIATDSRRLAWYALWLGITIGLVQIFVQVVMR